MTSVSLTGIQRQSNLAYREAIQTLRQSPGEGFAKLQEIGAVREVAYLERASAVADVYREMTANSGRSVLVVAATHEEVGRVTHAIRQDLKQHGQLGGGVELDRHVPLQWTEAQKKDIANYQPGQVLVFHRTSRGIEKHEALTVTSASGELITTRNERGVETMVGIGQARSFAVHDRQSIEVTAGDKLLMLANRKDDGFRATNGELTTVRSVDSDGIHLDDGRSIPANYREFTHGYAVTAHRSQGKTVDSVIISADVMKQELFYVSASRGREDIAILTSDVNRLGESLGVSMARPSALELANEIAQSKQPSVDLGPKLSIDLPTPQVEISLGQGFELSL